MQLSSDAPGSWWAWAAFTTAPQSQLINRLREHRQRLEASSRSTPRDPAVRIELPKEHRRFVNLLQRHLPAREEELLKLSESLSRAHDEKPHEDSTMPGGPKAGERNITLGRLQGFLSGRRIPSTRSLSRIVEALPDLANDGNRVLELSSAAEQARAARARTRHTARKQRRTSSP
ncbi:hypothetical protein [Kitasatospora sp. NPDC001132]